MQQTLTSTRPYFIRAIYEWLVDNGLTPQLLVNVRLKDVKVPMQYAKDGKIVLNASPTAVRGLELGNDWISFSARFAGTPHSLVFPVNAVVGIYARENSQGMFFEPEPETDVEFAERDEAQEADAPPLRAVPSAATDDEDPQPPRPPRGKPTLKRVK